MNHINKNKIIYGIIFVILIILLVLFLYYMYKKQLKTIEPFENKRIEPIENVQYFIIECILDESTNSLPMSEILVYDEKGNLINLLDPDIGSPYIYDPINSANNIDQNINKAFDIYNIFFDPTINIPKRTIYDAINSTKIDTYDSYFGLQDAKAKLNTTTQYVSTTIGNVIETGLGSVGLISNNQNQLTSVNTGQDLASTGNYINNTLKDIFFVYGFKNTVNISCVEIINGNYTNVEQLKISLKIYQNSYSNVSQYFKFINGSASIMRDNINNNIPANNNQIHNVFITDPSLKPSTILSINYFEPLIINKQLGTNQENFININSVDRYTKTIVSVNDTQLFILDSNNKILIFDKSGKINTEKITYNLNINNDGDYSILDEGIKLSITSKYFTLYTETIDGINILNIKLNNNEQNVFTNELSFGKNIKKMFCNGSFSNIIWFIDNNDDAYSYKIPNPIDIKTEFLNLNWTNDKLLKKNNTTNIIMASNYNNLSCLLDKDGNLYFVNHLNDNLTSIKSSLPTNFKPTYICVTGNKTWITNNNLLYYINNSSIDNSSSDAWINTYIDFNFNLYTLMCNSTKLYISLLYNNQLGVVSLPDISLPDISLPKISLSDISDISGISGETSITSGGTLTTSGGTLTTSGGTSTTSGGTSTTVGGTSTTSGGTSITAGGTSTTVGETRNTKFDTYDSNKTLMNLINEIKTLGPNQLKALIGNSSYANANQLVSPPQSHIVQTRFNGTSNIFSPYLYYEKGITEKFRNTK